MRIIELCGMPGAGKSTLVDALLQVSGGEGFLTRASLYSKYKRLNYFFTIIGIGLVKKGLYKMPLPEFNDIFCSFPDATPHAKYRLVDLYNRLSKISDKNGIIILEEGPLQYFSSLAYNEHFSNRDVFMKYWGLYRSMDFHAVYCDCSVQECVNRIAKRKKASAFYDPSNPLIQERMQIKRDNILYLLSGTGMGFPTINMEANIDSNTKELKSFIESIQSKQ